MAKKRTQPANGSEQPVQFRKKDAQRIGNTVHAHETSRRARNPSSLPRAAAGGGGGGVEVVYFTGAWPKDTVKTVYYSPNLQGTATASTLNFLCTIRPKPGARRGIVASVPSTTDVTLVLLNAEC